MRNERSQMRGEQIAAFAQRRVLGLELQHVGRDEVQLFAAIGVIGFECGDARFEREQIRDLLDDRGGVGNGP